MCLLLYVCFVFINVFKKKNNNNNNQSSKSTERAASSPLRKSNRTTPRRKRPRPQPRTPASPRQKSSIRKSARIQKLRGTAVDEDKENRHNSDDDGKHDVKMQTDATEASSLTNHNGERFFFFLSTYI